MNRDEVMKMWAGRGMDAMVAIEVMGWTYDVDWKQIIPPGQAKPPMWTSWMVDDETGEMYRKPIKEKHLNGVSYSGIEHEIILIPEYSTDIAAAWEVVEKFTDVTIEKAGLNYRVTINAWAEADAKEASLAICRAALLAKTEG